MVLSCLGVWSVFARQHCSRSFVLDPDRSHTIALALPYSRLLGHYLRPVLPPKNQAFRNSQDLKFLQDFKIFRIPKFEANFRLIYVNVIDYVKIYGMDWTSTLFQAESKQTNEKTQKKSSKKKPWSKKKNGYFTTLIVTHTRDGTGQVFLDPTGKYQNHRRLTGFWPARSTSFFTENFCSLFNVSNKKLSKGGHGWGVKICDFTRGSQKKTQKKLGFLQKWLNFKTFFGLVSVWKTWSSAKRAQNKHKKNWRVQAKLLDVLSNDILRKAKK